MRNSKFMQITCTQDQDSFKVLWEESVCVCEISPPPPAVLNKSCYTTTGSVLLHSHLFFLLHAVYKYFIGLHCCLEFTVNHPRHTSGAGVFH